MCKSANQLLESQLLESQKIIIVLYYYKNLTWVWGADGKFRPENLCHEWCIAMIPRDGIFYLQYTCVSGFPTLPRFLVVFLTASQFWHHLLNKIFWQNKMLFRPTMPVFFFSLKPETCICFLMALPCIPFDFECFILKVTFSTAHNYVDVGHFQIWGYCDYLW